MIPRVVGPATTVGRGNSSLYAAPCLAPALLPYRRMARGEYSESLRGVYLLLADGNATRRQLLREVFLYCGALVREAADATGARDVLREVTPSVLVLAVQPPGDEAWGLLRFVRSMRLEHGAKMPVIGVGPAALAAAGRMNGMDAYVVEPVDPWALGRVVADLTT
jgi:CheY-like chemotaxis protein